MNKSRTPSTAGRGDPYWYEWFVGLMEVVQLLDPTSNVERVAFQVEGVKGWDDVVVVLRAGGRRCYQVKHTRADESLTFGDLIEHDEKGESLLRALFQSWREGGLNDGVARCILYTNREAGERWASTKEGIRRPPLADFYRWLRPSADSAHSLADISPPSGFQLAWSCWQGELTPGSDQERLAFLRVLEIRVKQDDLYGLEARIRRKLAEAFGITDERAAPLFDSLCRALKKWTTGHTGVTAEDLCAELAIPAEPKELAPAPPPPTPFLPTRVAVADELERVLQDDSAQPVVFLTAEPGAGKTSVLSWLANRRTDHSFAGLVSARFFCFEPIRPENPIIAPDASRVRPDELWGSLLAQLREGLRGRLHDLRVPLRNNLLTWQQCRSHVLRLAGRIGEERRRRFTIVIDGIDHAARAAQTMPAQIMDFFASLPGPDELAAGWVRLLVAGQPPEHYGQQYPSWLLGPRPRVCRIDLPRLAAEDVRALYIQSHSRIPPEQAAEAVRVIEEHAKGNTLATVFAVAEAERVGDLGAFAATLHERRLADGLEAYYSSIWGHMLSAAGEWGRGVEPCLAGSLALARRGILAEFVADAFKEWERPLAWWRMLLEALGPLLTEGADGFRVRHNDIRVFLAARFTGFSDAQRRTVATQMADHYAQSGSDRLAAHWQLFDLLDTAGRSQEAGERFTVDWVLEAAALGIENEQLMREGRSAIRALASSRDWSRVVSVACATQTLERLREFREYSGASHPVAERNLPPFLPSEARVRPATQWSLADLQAVATDADELITNGEAARARSLLDRWFGGLDVCGVVDRLPDAEEDARLSHDRKALNEAARSAFKLLGRVSAVLEWALPPGEPSSDLQVHALFEFERGLVEAIAIRPDAVNLTDLFFDYTSYCLAFWEGLVQRLVSAGRWDLVGQALSALAPARDRLPATFRAESTWWALRSSASKEHPAWLQPLHQEYFGVTEAECKSFDLLEFDEKHVRALVNVARAIGWLHVDLDARDIADTVYRAYDLKALSSERGMPTRLLLRSGALLGRIDAAHERGGLDEIRDYVSAEQMGRVLTALWGDIIMKSHFTFKNRKTAADLARELADYCGLLGDDYEKAALAAARPIAEAFPADFRRPGIWSVLERTGQKEIMRSWIRHWLAADGKVWHLSRDDVQQIVSDFAPLAERLGDHELAQYARRRVGWLQIGYRSHKEYEFAHVLEWFREASRRRPEMWRDAGWKLWCICDECDAQGGDNRLEADILDTVSAAAMRCGAADWWRLLSSSLPRIKEPAWHNESRARLVDGAVIAARQVGDISQHDLLTLWCLGICFSFWTDQRDSASLIELREAILRGNTRETQQQHLDERLQAVSPRCVRVGWLDHNPPEQEDKGGAADSEPPPVEQVMLRARRGEEISLGEAARAVKETLRAGGEQAEDLICLLLRIVGSRQNFAVSWRHVEGETTLSLRRIGQMVSDDQLWCLVEAAARDLDRSPSWTQSISENLHSVALARAYERDVAELARDLDLQVEMHARWALGGDRTSSDLPRLSDGEGGLSWRDVGVRLLSHLLESYSAEVIAAALEGMHALVAHDALAIPDLFAGMSSDWAKRWLLSAAESWAALHPAALEGVSGWLEGMMTEGDLGLRLQAWIVLCKHSDETGRPRPAFPMTATPENASPVLIAGESAILHTSPKRMGSLQFVDRHASARSKLNRLAACGFDFSRLESVIAASLAAFGNEYGPSRPRKGPTRRNAFMCAPLDEESAVGRAVASVLSSKWFQQEDLPRLAQAFLQNEDAWMQRQPPRPSLHLADWPHKLEYSQEPINPNIVRQQLKELAVGREVPPGWRTFGAQVFTCSEHEDYVLRLWWEDRPDTFLLRDTSAPTCLSGRSFLWWLGDFVEHEPADRRFVSAFFVGGTQRLQHCNFDLQPSKSWRELGWRADLRDPLTWHRDGRAVARYERIHGPLRNNPHHPKNRQPILARWILSEEEFEQVERLYGSLIQREEFEAHPFSTEGE